MTVKTRSIVRNYSHEDKENLLELFQSCWDEEKMLMNRDCWEWLYELNPNTAPDRPVIFILEEKEKLIGSVSCVPAKLMVNGDRYNFHWVMDFMVHPKHRGGLKGFKLAREVIQLSATTLGSGFPIQETVPIWLRAGKKVGVDEVGGFAPMVHPLSVRYLLQHKILARAVTRPLDLLFRPVMSLLRAYRSLGAKRKTGARLTRVERFDSRMTEFFARVGQAYPIIVERDEPYLNWRFSDYPGKAYEKVVAEDSDGTVRGYLVTRMVKKHNGIREGTLVDFLVERGDEATLRLLIKDAITSFRRSGCDVVKGLEFYLPDMRTFMERLGFVSHPVKRHYLIFYNEICPEHPKSFFREKENWYITRNFSDQEINEFLD